MKPMTIEYLESAIDQERQIAILLAKHANEPMPEYRRDWAAAGKLIGSYKISITLTDDAAMALIMNGKLCIESVANHPSADFALFAAVCNATISHLSKKDGD